MNNTMINLILFVITVISKNFVRYNQEIFLIKYDKPNQTTYFVCYNRVFVITVIVITEFDCTILYTNVTIALYIILIVFKRAIIQKYYHISSKMIK